MVFHIVNCLFESYLSLVIISYFKKKVIFRNWHPPLFDIREKQTKSTFSAKIKKSNVFVEKAASNDVKKQRFNL